MVLLVLLDGELGVMPVKTVFLCETNHADQAVRITGTELVRELMKHGYNQLFVEWDEADVEEVYQFISDDYSTYENISKLQLSRFFELSKSCPSEPEITEMQLLITVLEAIQNRVLIHHFEDAVFRKAFFDSMRILCEFSSDKQALDYFAFRLQDHFNLLSKSLDDASDVRDLEIVNSFAKLHNNTVFGDKNIVMAGLEHCVDFYNYASKEGNLHEYKFVQIKPNLTTLSHSDLGDIENSKQDNQEIEWSYICGKSSVNAIMENIQYFGLDINKLGLADDTCEMKYDHYNLDHTNVVRCDINVKDLGSYQNCLHNVTQSLVEAS